MFKIFLRGEARKQRALEEYDSGRQAKPEHQRSRKYKHLAGRHRSLRQRVVDKASGIGGKCFLKSYLLAALKQEGIYVDLYFLFTEYFLIALVDRRQRSQLSGTGTLQALYVVAFGHKACPRARQGLEYPAAVVVKFLLHVDHQWIVRGAAVDCAFEAVNLGIICLYYAR